MFKRRLGAIDVAFLEVDVSVPLPLLWFDVAFNDVGVFSIIRA